MFSSIIEAGASGYVNVRQLEHNIEFFYIITAIGLAKALFTYQSTESYSKSSPFVKTSTIWFGYSIVFILFFAQFFEPVKVFLTPFFELLYDFAVELWD